jgi:hypothetical protein
MSSEKRHAKWWQLYVMLPLLVALLLIEMRLPFTPTEHVIAQIGIFFLIFGCVQMWLRANRTARMDLDQQERKWPAQVYGIPPARTPVLNDSESRKSQRPIFKFPESGLKGVLSTTFELEIPEKDPEEIPAEESPRPDSRITDRLNTPTK